MKKVKIKRLISILVLLLGSIFTVSSALYYYLSVSQEDITYSSIPFQKGMSFTTWGAVSFNSEVAKAEILEMKEIGIEWVGVNIWWFQENVSASKIFSGDWTDSASNIIDFFQFVHSQGMHVLFKPMLDSQDGIWRSYIKATPDWILAYNEFIKQAAELAEQGDVDIFCIGCEMGNWQVLSQEVRTLIKELREIYSGKLTYAANHDSFWYIDWWDAVDIIGLDAYFPFTLSYDPSLQDMIDVWNGFYDDLNKFQRTWNRSILFIELGCQNRDGCNIAPNDNKFRLEQDEQEFKMFYQSLFESRIWNAPWFKGTYWWMWDCRIIDEETDNSFTPQLSVIKDTLNEYYNKERSILSPPYWLTIALILILGGFLVFSLIEIIERDDLPIKDAGKNVKEDLPVESDDNAFFSKIDNPFALYVLINGLALGSFICWAFTFYNQGLFNLLYGMFTKSIFLGEDIVSLLFIILISLGSMVVLWMLIQQLYSKGSDHRTFILVLLIVSIVILILFINAWQASTLSNQPSLKIYIILQLLILLGALFTFTLTHLFPTQSFKVLKTIQKEKFIIKIFLEIIGIMLIVLLVFSMILHVNIEAASLMLGFIGVNLMILTYIYKKSELSKVIVSPLEKENQSESEITIKKIDVKVLEAVICIVALAYYYGILRYYDSHTLINFNLTVLPNFFFPLGISALIGLGISYRGIDSLAEKRARLYQHRYVIIMSLIRITIVSSIIAIFTCWMFSLISFYIALLLGGIPFILLFLMYLLGMVKNSSNNDMVYPWKRMTLYLVIILTIAFSANGIMSGLLYALTFFAMEDGQFVVRTVFDTELGFDAIQLLHDIQFLISMLLLVLALIGHVLVNRRIKRELRVINK